MHRILLVDDVETTLDDIENGLRGELSDLEMQFERQTSFDEAESMLKVEDFDLVVLDIMDGDSTYGDKTRGRELYIRLQEARWIPVIFYSAVADDELDLQREPLVSAVTKGDTKRLYSAARSALASNAAPIARVVTLEIDRMTRKFFRDHVTEFWDGYSSMPSSDVQRILLSRIAAWMREWKLGGVTSEDLVAIGHVAEASSYYLVPPVASHGHRSGSILQQNGDWFVVLTPTCDLFSGEGRPVKAEFVLLASASPAAAALAQLKNPKEIVSGHPNRARWFYLPSFLTIPDLVVDLENIRSVPADQLGNFDRVADLDSPFAENLLIRNSQWRGRVGKPDLDFSAERAKFGL